jgi:hypothetical protein
MRNGTQLAKKPNFAMTKTLELFSRQFKTKIYSEGGSLIYE